MASRTLTVIPIQAPVQTGKFNLLQTLTTSLLAAGEHLLDGDVLAVSSKYTAISEGRIITLSEVEVSEQASMLAARYQMNPTMAELVVKEADYIFVGITGLLLTRKDGISSPKAGIER